MQKSEQKTLKSETRHKKGNRVKAASSKQLFYNFLKISSV